MEELSKQIQEYWNKRSQDLVQCDAENWPARMHWPGSPIL